MANYIFKNKAIILRCSCLAMGVLHDELLETIKQEQITVSTNIIEFIELLDQDVYGSGVIHVDLEKVLVEKSDQLQLKDLVGKIVQRLKEGKILNERFAPRIITDFEGFRDNILD